MEGTIGEIRMFAGTFAPRSWAFCQNQQMSIAQNTALFSILGTTYGGNGQTTFSLPDFRYRMPIGVGTGAGLPNVVLGQLSGTPSATLSMATMPAHNHQLTGTLNQQANSDGTLSTDGTNRYLGPVTVFTNANADLVQMQPAISTLALGLNGGGQPFSVMPPYLGMNYVICLFGIFPSRN